ncbi:serine hydrolase domain-containing protein [Occallatibacter riparius]|uniref:Beta-lactamase family protein n=1 Tax=Occallatibacter riparius TaxID=1002689 RepID=A0A9J7BM39_9BACT|nr:serine hydrolase domain-containing protein [Occallatibacter riparius]UWZ81974.1 beta-lactamase family protein [Occallatibacter riparius]
MLKIGFVAAVVACGAAIACAAQTVDTIDPALKSRIDRIAAGVMEQHGVPSASVAVVQGGKLVYTHAYGKAHVSPDKPATPDMRYSIGSISKQFTAAAILILQEQGKLKLDDAVGKYVPGLTRGDEVTIRQILSHTSGYQDYWPEDYLMTPMMKPTTAQYIIDTWAKKPLDFEPGTQWQYSNTNYVIAGMIVEKVSGQKLMEFLAEHIFHPLGMKSVWDTDQEKLTQTDATAYIRAALGPLRAAPKEGRNWMFAAGELAMTAHDLALWDESMIARSVLKPESYKEMFTEVKLKDGKGTHYGLGVEVLDHDGKLEIEHSGEVTGFVSDNIVLPDDGVAVAVLTNHMASGAGQIASLAADTVAGAKRSPAEEQTLAMYRGLQNGQIDRSLLAPNLNDYFDTQTVDDFRNSLGPLGEPLTFRQTGESLRGGMTFRGFRIVYPTRTLRLSTYTYPDGKLEQFLVEPGN